MMSTPTNTDYRKPIADNYTPIPIPHSNKLFCSEISCYDPPQPLSLVEAILKNRDADVKFLLQKDPDLVMTDSEGKTPVTSILESILDPRNPWESSLDTVLPQVFDFLFLLEQVRREDLKENQQSFISFFKNNGLLSWGISLERLFDDGMQKGATRLWLLSHRLIRLKATLALAEKKIRKVDATMQADVDLALTWAFESLYFLQKIKDKELSLLQNSLVSSLKSLGLYQPAISLEKIFSRGMPKQELKEWRTHHNSQAFRELFKKESLAASIIANVCEITKTHKFINRSMTGFYAVDEHVIAKKIADWISKSSISFYYKESLVRSFNRTAELAKKMFPTRSSNPDLTVASDILDSIRNKELVPLPLGWVTHSLVVIFYPFNECVTYLTLVNGGTRPSGTSPIAVYQIASKLITLTLVTRMVEVGGGDQKEGVNFFYKILPEALSENQKIHKDPLCRKVESLSANEQFVNNCPYACKQAAILPLLFFQHLNRYKLNSSFVNLNDLRNTTTLLSREFEIAALEDYLQDHGNFLTRATSPQIRVMQVTSAVRQAKLQPPCDSDLLQEACKKMMAKFSKIKPSAAPLPKTLFARKPNPLKRPCEEEKENNPAARKKLKKE